MRPVPGDTAHPPPGSRGRSHHTELPGGTGASLRQLDGLRSRRRRGELRGAAATYSCCHGTATAPRSGATTTCFAPCPADGAVCYVRPDSLWFASIRFT